MQLETLSQTYIKQGYLKLGTNLIEGLLPEITTACEEVYKQARFSESLQVEKYSDGLPKIIFGPHLINPRISELCLMQQFAFVSSICLYPKDLYLYQTKLTNSSPKQPKSGFPWHQDYHNWRVRDGVPTDQMINIVVFIDDVKIEDGPIEVFPSSHSRGYRASDGPRLPTQQLIDLDFPPIPITGKRGTLLLMHPCLVHGSRAKSSNRRRLLLFVTFNTSSNAPNMSSQQYYSESRRLRFSHIQQTNPI